MLCPLACADPCCVLPSPTSPRLSLPLPSRSLDPHRPVVPMEYMGEDYFKLKNQVIKFERFILKVCSKASCLSLVVGNALFSPLSLSSHHRSLDSVSMSSIPTRCALSLLPARPFEPSSISLSLSAAHNHLPAIFGDGEEQATCPESVVRAGGADQCALSRNPLHLHYLGT